MGKGGSDGINGVVNLLQVFNFENLFDHEFDLFFISATVTGDRGFYLERGVATDFEVTELAN